MTSSSGLCINSTTHWNWVELGYLKVLQVLLACFLLIAMSLIHFVHTYFNLFIEGTGKTMSLICGSLHWLQDYRQRSVGSEGDPAENRGGCDEDDEPDWMTEFSEKHEIERRKLLEDERAKRIEKARLCLAQMAESKIKVDDLREQSSDEEFLIDEGEHKPNLGRKRATVALDVATSSDEELPSAPFGDHDVRDDELERTQIIFCSRTHSQLIQFVGELEKTQFAERVSLVSLGSRKALCINPDVRKLNSPAMMNERCLEIQSKKKDKKIKRDIKEEKTRGGCPFYKRGSDALSTLRDMILSKPMDIEDLASLGNRRSTCPYYASREAALESDIILAPYSALLVQETRESLGLKIQGNIVIIDEAHNLIDAINNSHSTTLSISGIKNAEKHLQFYFDRFRTRLAPKNAHTVQTLILVAQALVKRFPYSSMATSQEHAQVLTVNDLLFCTGLDNINMFELGRNMRENKFMYKIGGYWKSKQDGGDPDDRQGESNCLQDLLNFIKSLTFNNDDGRVIVNKESQVLKYVMLNASTNFEKIVSEARSVILASGTLSPLEGVMELFQGRPPELMKMYTCGHIVSKNRLMALAVPSGPSGKVFDFRHHSRNQHDLMLELGMSIINICKVTPGGIVVFFPSFSYCDQVYSTWQRQGILSKIEHEKTVYKEPRSANDVDGILSKYISDIEKAKGTKHGAIILAVVGAKLAEGINFGDDMGRCVVMVGLPYPNPTDPELQARMKFIDKMNLETPSKKKQSSKEYYTNLCMKAVNQCIGRAIRHKNDYAAILLLDQRCVQKIWSVFGR